MRKKLIIIALIIVAAVLLWLFVLTKTFLFVSTDTGEFRIYQNGVEVVHVQKDGLAYLSKGHYVVASIEKDTPRTIEYTSTNFLPIQLVKITSSDKSSTPLEPQLTLGRQAGDLTPLGDGYIYKNIATRGIEYADKSGIKDVSSLFGIESKDISDTSDTYNAVVNITNDNGTVYVTTTRAIFKLTSLNDIKKSSFTGHLITRSYLNKELHKMLFITFESNGTYSSYSLPSDDITGQIQQIFTGKLLINRITAGGDYALVNDDNIPSTDKATVDSYGTKKQVIPMLINLKTLKSAPLQGFPSSTVLSEATIDPTGTYVAYRTKLSSHITVATIKDGKKVTNLPATTLTSMVWAGSTLNFTYGPLVVSYSPGADNYPTVTMTAPSEITGLSFRGSVPVVSTNDNYTFVGSPNATQVDLNAITISSSKENYTMSFSDIDNSLHVYKLCGNYSFCELGSSYSSTMSQLSKIGNAAAAVQDADSDFFAGNYSYQQSN